MSKVIKIHLSIADKTFLTFSGASSSTSICSFATVIHASVGIASASISLVFLVINGILNIFLKTVKKKINTENMAYWLGVNVIA